MTQRPLEVAIANLAAIAEDHPEELRIWSVAALASRLGLVVVVTPGGAEHDVEAIAEVGTAFVDQVVQRLDDEPDEQGETLRAAWEVVDRLVADLRRRGLTPEKSSALPAFDGVGANEEPASVRRHVFNETLVEAHDVGQSHTMS